MLLINNVYNQIKRDVFKAKYSPDEFITERKVCEKYGVSKVTAGEALHRLCAEGHLTSYPRSGYMVTPISKEEMEQLKRLRITIESLVIDIICKDVKKEKIQTLCENIKNEFSNDDNANTYNSEFHMEMAKLTEDNYIINTIENLLGSATRVRQPILTENYEQWQGYHKNIVEALLNRDAIMAKAFLVLDINQR